MITLLPINKVNKNEVNIKIKDFDARVRKVEEEKKRQLEMQKKAETLKKEIYSANSSSSPSQVSSISSPDFTHAANTLSTLFALATEVRILNEMCELSIPHKYGRVYIIAFSFGISPRPIKTC